MKPLDILIIVIASLITGSDSVVSRFSLSYADPFFNGAIKAFLNASVMLLFCQRQRVFKDNFRNLFWMCAIGMIGGAGFINMGIKSSQSMIVTNAILQTTVVFSTLYGALFFREKISRKHILGILAVIAGTTLISYKPSLPIYETSGGYESPIFYMSMLLIGVALSPFVLVFAKKFSGRLLPHEIAAYGAVISLFMCLGASFALESGQIGSLQAILSSGNLLVALSFVFGGPIVCGLAGYMNNSMLRKYPLSKLAVFFPLGTMVATAEAIIFLDEKLTPLMACGYVLATSGILFTSKVSKSDDVGRISDDREPEEEQEEELARRLG